MRACKEGRAYEMAWFKEDCCRHQTEKAGRINPGGVARRGSIML